MSSAYTASKPFLFITLPLPESRLGLGNRLGGDTARMADPNWPKGYSIP